MQAMMKTTCDPDIGRELGFSAVRNPARMASAGPWLLLSSSNLGHVATAGEPIQIGVTTRNHRQGTRNDDVGVWLPVAGLSVLRAQGPCRDLL